MATIRLHASGSADPDEVWERYAQPGLWATWAPQIRGVRTDASRLHDGATGEVIAPLGVRIPFTVARVDEANHRWTWVVARLGIRVHLEHSVGPLPGGARTDLRLRGPLPVVLAYAPLAQLALTRLVSGRR